MITLETALISHVAMLIGSGVTLVTVWLTNRANTRRMAMQLAHERTTAGNALYRDRLEELYVLSGRYCHALAGRPGAAAVDAADLSRLEMLVHMYFPDLLDALKGITGVRDRADGDGETDQALERDIDEARRSFHRAVIDLAHGTGVVAPTRAG